MLQGKAAPALVVTAGSAMSVVAWLTCCKALGASEDEVRAQLCAALTEERGARSGSPALSWVLRLSSD